MAQAKYYNFGIFLITAISGSIFTMALSMLISKINLVKVKNIINYIGQHTLTIFVTHQFFLIIMSDIFSKINMKIPNYILVMITTIVALLGGLAIDKIIKLDIWRKEKVNT